MRECHPPFLPSLLGTLGGRLELSVGRSVPGGLLVLPAVLGGMCCGVVSKSLQNHPQAHHMPRGEVLGQEGPSGVLASLLASRNEDPRVAGYMCGALIPGGEG